MTRWPPRTARRSSRRVVMSDADRPLVLASQSPRRRALMSVAGYTFLTRTADVDETPRPGEAPADYTLRLSRQKARAVAGDVPARALVIAADTTVAFDGELLGKPATAAEARHTLQQLRGQPHQVYTAISVLDAASGALAQDLATTDLQMRPYSEAEIEAYIATGDPFDKAGSYAIQHPDFAPVAAITGCYANVVGLPLCHLTRTLRRFGIQPTADVPAACQQANDIECPVYEEILM